MQGRVYFILQEDFPLERGWVKIGWTAGDPKERRRTFQIGNPDPLRLIATAPGTQRDEKWLHGELAFFRAERGLDGGGEWFALSGLWEEIEIWGNHPRRTIAELPGLINRAFDLQLSASMAEVC